MTVDSRSSIPFPSPNAFHERLATLLPEFDAVDWVKSTGSTNKDLGDFARAMASTAALSADVPVSTVAAASWPRLLGAHLQTAGKGRAARPWHNAAGECLMFSCGFTSKIGMGELPGVAPALGIASCLALRSVLAPLLGARAAHQLTLKWPNDLQWKGAKLAGILVETAPSTKPQQPLLVIGMGLNLSGAAALSADLNRPVADLSQILVGHAVDPISLVATLAQAWQRTLHDYAAKGYAAFAPRYQEVDGLLGEHVDVIDQGKLLHTGIACGTDSIGRLQIETASGLLPILVGDVSIRARASQHSSSERNA
jgi:BirA family transcriptional regulator, biotin operon repressor / biotin---[acetyl-CoA-carboxylase] ligase